MMLGLGYGLGAFSPLILGVARDATGSFTASLWILVAAAITVFGLCLLLTNERLRRGVRPTGAPEATTPAGTRSPGSA
jgi:cyanate permease